MRLDLFLLDHPTQEFGRSIGRSLDPPLRCHLKAAFYPIHHRLGCVDLACPEGGRGFHIDDDPTIYIQQTVGRIGKTRRRILEPSRLPIGDGNWRPLMLNEKHKNLGRLSRACVHRDGMNIFGRLIEDLPRT